jgi:ABC-type transport system involved in multi-copper enzyme maturation permease subunit
MLGGRRSSPLLLRRIYTGWLLLQFAIFYWFYLIESNTLGHSVFGGAVDTSAADHFGNYLTYTLITQTLLLLFVLTPAFVAGAITDEKSRGTLYLLLTADLASWEIVTGKLLGRVSRVLLLSLAVLPMLAFSHRFNSVGLTGMAVLGFISVVVAFTIGCLSVLASVWSRQTREAVAAVYGLLTLGFTTAWLTGQVGFISPLAAIEPACAGTQPWSEFVGRLSVFAGVWCTTALICLGLAIWRLRPATVKQLENVGRPGRRSWLSARRPPIGEAPVRWKERYLHGVAPFAWMRSIPAWVGILVTLASVLVGLGYVLSLVLAPTSLTELLNVAEVQEAVQKWPRIGRDITTLAVAAIVISTLLIGARCSGAITGEREKQTWEALLLTPLTADQLVRGKLRGILGASLPYLLAYAIPFLAFSCLGGPLLLIRAVALLAVTLLAIYFVGAVGLWCSAHSKNSWRSLLATVAVSYACGFGLWLIAWPVGSLFFVVVMITLMLVDQLYQINLTQSWMLGWVYWLVGICLGFALGFLFIGRSFLNRAQAYISTRERTRHWKEQFKSTSKITRQPLKTR